MTINKDNKQSNANKSCNSIEYSIKGRGQLLCPELAEQ